MGSCCDAGGSADVFDTRFSGHLARRYRRRGLDRTASRMVAFLAEHGVEGASVLETGGGVGAGLGDRVTRRQLDLAASPGTVEPHDIVVLHRVVCCYPDYERLLTAAADHASRLLVFSHPPRNPVSRAVFATENLLFRLRRRTFRAHLHDPDAMVAVAAHSHLEERFRHRGLAWHVVGLASPDAV